MALHCIAFPSHCNALHAFHPSKLYGVGGFPGAAATKLYRVGGFPGAAATKLYGVGGFPGAAATKLYRVGVPEIPPALWATGGLGVVTGKITPSPTLSPGLQSSGFRCVAGEQRFHQTI